MFTLANTRSDLASKRQYEHQFADSQRKRCSLVSSEIKLKSVNFSVIIRYMFLSAGINSLMWITISCTRHTPSTLTDKNYQIFTFARLLLQLIYTNELQIRKIKVKEENYSKSVQLIPLINPWTTQNGFHFGHF